MNDMKLLAGQLDWAAQNLAYNLDFIPDDKLGWKPAPTALSALEVVGHLLGVYGYFAELMDGSSGDFTEPQTPSSRAEAKEKLIAAAQEYSRRLLAITPEDAAHEVELSFGKFPLGLAASMPVTDTIHHHGQIAYIQSLLGDTESHFDFSLLPK